MSIVPGRIHGTTIPSLPLTDFLCLRTFGVRVKWMLSGIEQLCSWLSQLPPSPVLCEVKLDITIQASMPQILDDNWELLDQTLSDLFRDSRSGIKKVTICFYTCRLPMYDHSMVPAEYRCLGMVIWYRDTGQYDPIAYSAVEKRVSYFIFKVSIAPKFLKLFGSTDIDFMVTLGGETPPWAEDE